MSRFTQIPAIPDIGLTDWQSQTMAAMKENVELLIGTRGERDGLSRAVTKSSITVAAPPEQTMRQVTAVGGGYTISGVNVPSIEDYVKLIGNVQQLANDVATLRSVVATLITQLKG